MASEGGIFSQDHGVEGPVHQAFRTNHFRIHKDMAVVPRWVHLCGRSCSPEECSRAGGEQSSQGKQPSPLHSPLPLGMHSYL